jgi:hypothetical protein
VGPTLPASTVAESIPSALAKLRRSCATTVDPSIRAETLATTSLPADALPSVPLPVKFTV